MGKVLAFITQLPHSLYKLLVALHWRGQRQQTQIRPLMDLRGQENGAHGMAPCTASEISRQEATRSDDGEASIEPVVDEDDGASETLLDGEIRITEVEVEHSEGLRQDAAPLSASSQLERVTVKGLLVWEDTDDVNANANISPSSAEALNDPRNDIKEEEEPSTPHEQNTPVLKAIPPLTPSRLPPPYATFPAKYANRPLPAPPQPTTTTTTEFDPSAPLHRISAQTSLALNNDSNSVASRTPGQRRETVQGCLGNRTTAMRGATRRFMGLNDWAEGRAGSSNLEGGFDVFATSTDANDDTTGMKEEAQDTGPQALEPDASLPITSGTNTFDVIESDATEGTAAKEDTAKSDLRDQRAVNPLLLQSTASATLASGTSMPHTITRIAEPEMQSENKTLPKHLPNTKDKHKAKTTSTLRHQAPTNPSPFSSTPTQRPPPERVYPPNLTTHKGPHTEQVLYLTGFPLDPLDPDHAPFRADASTSYGFREEWVWVRMPRSRGR
jgi:hypothetical protein